MYTFEWMVLRHWPQMAERKCWGFSVLPSWHIPVTSRKTIRFVVKCLHTKRKVAALLGHVAGTGQLRILGKDAAHRRDGAGYHRSKNHNQKKTPLLHNTPLSLSLSLLETDCVTSLRKTLCTHDETVDSITLQSLSPRRCYSTTLFFFFPISPSFFFSPNLVGRCPQSGIYADSLAAAGRDRSAAVAALDILAGKKTTEWGGKGLSGRASLSHWLSLRDGMLPSPQPPLPILKLKRAVQLNSRTRHDYARYPDSIVALLVKLCQLAKIDGNFDQRVNL